MYSAFQSNAFQNNAFQIIASQATGLLGGGPGGGNKRHHEYTYKAPSHGIREREFHQQLAAQHRAELRRVEDNLAAAEHKRQEALTAENEKRKSLRKAKQLAALEAALLDEINKLRIQRAWLMRRIDDEETILVLLLSMPFVH